VLDAVKVWPIYEASYIEVGATANLEGVCARRLRSAMPERRSLRCAASLHLTLNARKPSGTILNEAIRRLTQIVAPYSLQSRGTAAGLGRIRLGTSKSWMNNLVSQLQQSSEQFR
jgi:hypothetical protein